jgi:hypothetical protein
MYETDDLSITTNVKLTTRNSNGEEVSGLTQSFTFEVDNTGYVSPCKNAVLTKESEAYDTYLSFGDYDWQDHEVYSALETTSDNFKCSPVYKLYAFSPYAAPDDGWMPWEDLVELMEGELASGKF